MASASANTLYVADGLGSGTWKKITPDALDSGTVFTTNVWMPTLTYVNLVAVTSRLLTIPRSMTLLSVQGVINATLGTANSVVTFNKKGGFTIGSMTVLSSGSAKGDTYTLSSLANNSFAATDWIEVVSGGTGTGTVDLFLAFTFSITG